MLYDKMKFFLSSILLRSTVFGLHRTDYLINAVQDTPSLGILQVEINTIASSYAGLQSKMNNFHE